ncbi:MAG: sugar phosphate isomerase/epimerase [bacterium]|nr:sugar phosphate isomerase/epimerase [bacterium]
MSSRPARPPIPKSKALVAVGHAVDYELRCAREFGLGVEVQRFAHPAVLAGDWRDELRRMARRVARVKGPVGMHGPFIDTVHFSLDGEIQDVARKRYLAAFDMAEELGACYVLFHSQYNPIIKIRPYPDIYHNGSLEFWPDVLENAARRGLTVYLENMFDPTPGPLRRLVDALDCPQLKLCLDVSHARVFSGLDVAAWVDGFGDALAHVHLNDTTGDYDDHVELGKGSLDLVGDIRLIRKAAPNATFTLETGQHTRASLRYLGFAPLKRKRPSG